MKTFTRFFKRGNFKRDDVKTTILNKIEKGQDLSKENFINADLSHITLNDIDFSGLDLTGVIFTGTKFHNVKFINTILNAAILTDTELYNVDLRGAKLRDADLIGAKMIGVKLNGADLTRTDLTDADLTDAKLQKIDEYKTIFNETILSGTKFYGANLSHNDLRNVDVTNTLFVPDEFPSNKKLQLAYADLRGCELTGIDLRGSNLIGIDLRGANLTDAKLQKTDLTGAKLQELVTDTGERIPTNLTGANLTDAGAREANLTGANLTNAILIKTSFVSSILTDANLTGVTLDKTKFLSSILDGTSLNLEQIKETKSKIKGATISRTNLSFSRYKSPSHTRTKKIASKLKKISSITKPENCITILIVAHGGVYPNKSIDPNLMNDVHISEMAGGIDINGLFGTVTNPITPIVNKYDNKIVYNIDSNRISSDASLEIIYKTYPYLLEKYNLLEGAKCAETFYSIFQDIVYYIKEFYTNIGCSHFPKDGDYDLDHPNYRKYRESFTIFDSYQEKIFSFIPEPYEFCMTKTKNGCSKLIPERERQLTYGITMLQSSELDDQPYTLAGMSLVNSGYKNAILSKWRRDTERDYWRQKIENRRHINGDETDYYLFLYEKISNPLDPEGLYNHPDKNKTSILLSQLLRLLKMGMGFTNINIIDYSCNDCIYKISNFKRAVIDLKNSNSRLKEYRKLRTTVKNRPSGVKEWDSIINPSFYKIIQDIGKANSEQQKIRGKSKTIKRKSFGGKSFKKTSRY